MSGIPAPARKPEMGNKMAVPLPPLNFTGGAALGGQTGATYFGSNSQDNSGLGSLPTLIIGGVILALGVTWLIKR